MERGHTTAALNDFLGCVHAFASAVDEVVGRRLLRQVAGPQVTFSQLKLLQLVALADCHTLGDLATYLGVSHPAASKAVDRLVHRKLLRRTEQKADRRALELSLTERSRRLLSAYNHAKNHKLERIFRHFSGNELKRIAVRLDHLTAGIVDHNARPDETCVHCGIYFRESCLLRKLVPRNCFYQRHKNRGHGREATRTSGATNGSGRQPPPPPGPHPETPKRHARHY